VASADSYCFERGAQRTMTDMDRSDEFAEVEVTEDQFDEMFAAGEPTTVEGIPSYAERLRAASGSYWTISTDSSAHHTSGTWGRSAEWATSTSGTVLSPA
jgi:hypothetical protein